MIFLALLAIDSSFGSPTLWNKIAEYAFRIGTTLPTIRRVFMAGAAVPATTIARVQGVLPNAVVSTPYGATESLPVTYISAEELAATERVRAVTGEQGTLVGKAVPGVKILSSFFSFGLLESLNFGGFSLLV